MHISRVCTFHGLYNVHVNVYVWNIILLQHKTVSASVVCVLFIWRRCHGILQIALSHITAVCSIVGQNSWDQCPWNTQRPWQHMATHVHLHQSPSDIISPGTHVMMKNIIRPLRHAANGSILVVFLQQSSEPRVNIWQMRPTTSYIVHRYTNVRSKDYTILRGNIHYIVFNCLKYINFSHKSPLSSHKIPNMLYCWKEYKHSAIARCWHVYVHNYYIPQQN